MKILATGFTPFGGEQINPSWEAVKRLPERVGEAVLLKREIPTEFDAACAAGTLWREVAYCAGQRTDAVHGGIGTFHTQLFDVLEEKIFDTETNL